jgi:creatinine deaminase
MTDTASPIDYDAMQELAFALAKKSFDEGGCPIGAVLCDSSTGAVLGRGHNNLVQEGNPILHGEMSALRDAGRMSSRRNTTMFTSLSPCMMCTGAMIQFKVGCCVISDVTNCGDNSMNLRLLSESGCKIVVREHAATVELCRKFREEKPLLWLEDWGGK